MVSVGKIDLHMHSTVSDGTDAPCELISRVENAGITIFSLTDHDAVKGSEQILTEMSRRQTEGLSFITGVEFSCRDEKGKYHILGYGYQPSAESIRSVVDYGHSLRMQKVRKRIDFIGNEFGFVFPKQELEKLYSMDNPGKPHIGNLMVKYGYARSKEIAINNYLNKLRLPSDYVRPEQAIDGIINAGGVPVLAHPFFGNGDQLIVGNEMSERLKHLVELGIQGVEAFYSGFSPKLVDEMLVFSEKFNLFVTAGSDYHGTNKLVCLGDTGIKNSNKIPKGMTAFFERVL